MTNLANGPIIFTYYAESELSRSTGQYGIIKKRGKRPSQKIETVRYYVLFYHTFSDWNYSKVCKFRTYTTSHSFFNYVSLIFQINTVQWLNCTNLKYYLNRSYNGGGVVYVLKARHLIHPYCRFQLFLGHLSGFYSPMTKLYNPERWAKSLL